MLNEFRSTSITWDKATRRIYSPITANASDSNGRKLNIQVVNSGQVENLTGATLHLYWETKDKTQHGLDAFTASDISKGEFELFYTTGMLSNVGELNATLVLVDSTGKVVSDWFKITVTRGINEDAIESENSFSSLTQALIDISNLEQNYAPRLNDLTAQLQQTEQELSSQLAQTIRIDESNLSLNNFKESDRAIIQGLADGEINAVLGNENVTNENLAKNAVDYTKTDFFELNTQLNLFDGHFISRTILGDSSWATLGVGTDGVHQTVKVFIKPNTTYSVIKEKSSIFKLSTDTIPDRNTIQGLNGAVYYDTPIPDSITHFTFTTGENDVVLYVYVSNQGESPFVQVVEGEQTTFTIQEYPINPVGVSVYSKDEIDKMLSKGIEKEKIVFFGDSKTRMLDYPSLIQNMSNYDCYNISISGGTVYRNPIGGATDELYRRVSFKNIVDCMVVDDFTTIDNVYSQLNALNKQSVDLMKTINLSDMDRLVFWYGTNDYGLTLGDPLVENDWHILPHLKQTLEKLAANYPHLKVYCILPPWVNGRDDSRILEYVEGFRSVTEDMFHIPSYDIYRNGQINQYNHTYYMTDGIHQNSRGNELIAKQVMNFINNH